MIKKLSKNFIAVFLGEGLSYLIGFFINAYIARTLGTEGFGLINYSLAFLTYLLLFSNMGLTTLGTREVARDWNNTRIIGEVTGARFVLTLILIVLFLSLLVIIPGAFQTKKMILIFLITGIPCAFYLDFVFQAREEMEFVAGGRIIQYLIYFIFLVLFLKNKEQILVVPSSFLIGYIISTLILIIFFIRRYKRLHLTVNLKKLFQTLTSALPIGLATIIYQAVINFPVIWLNIFYGDKETGIFSAGFKVILLLLVTERIFYYLFFPIFSRQIKENPQAMPKIITSFSWVAAGITISIATISGIFARELINLIYGTEFIPATLTLRILLLYFIISPLNTLWGYALIALDREKNFFNIISAMGGINLTLTMLFGYLFKSIGVALAMVLSELCGLLMMYWKLNTVIPLALNPFKNKSLTEFCKLFKI